MATFFLTCAIAGAGVLLLQVVLGLLGAGHDGGMDAADAAHGGLDLLSVRALSAGLAAFGAGGLLGLQTLGPVAALVLAPLLGLTAAFAIAWLMRAMLRLEADGTLRLENAIGATARVHLGIPAAKAGAGKVHVTVQGRTVELDAVTAHDRPLPTGAAVVVIDVAGSDVVEVAPESAILPTEVTHAAP